MLVQFYLYVFPLEQCQTPAVIEVMSFLEHGAYLQNLGLFDIGVNTVEFSVENLCMLLLTTAALQPEPDRQSSCRKEELHCLSPGQM